MVLAQHSSHHKKKTFTKKKTFFPSSNLFINYVSLQQAFHIIPNSCHRLLTWTVVIILSLQVVLGLCQQLGLGLRCDTWALSRKRQESHVRSAIMQQAGCGRPGEVQCNPHMGRRRLREGQCKQYTSQGEASTSHTQV